MELVAIVYHAEFDSWTLLRRVEQRCEMCSTIGAYVAYTILSDGDTVPNCFGCLNQWCEIVEVIEL